MNKSLFAPINVQSSQLIIESKATSTNSKASSLTKSPLTPIGVQGKIEELYQFSDAELQNEAMAIQDDFKAWIKVNFFLSFKQRAYLNDLNTQITTHFGAQCSICFSNRLPIELIYPIPPGTDYSKWTGTANSLVLKSDGSGKSVATGKLTFEFTYSK